MKAFINELKANNLHIQQTLKQELKFSQKLEKQTEKLEKIVYGSTKSKLNRTGQYGGHS